MKLFITIFLGLSFLLFLLKWVCKKSNALLGITSILTGVFLASVLKDSPYTPETVAAAVVAGILFLIWNPVVQSLRKESIETIVGDYKKRVS